MDTRRQMQLVTDVADYLETSQAQRRGARTKKPAYDSVVWLVASLERLPAVRKTALGAWLLAQLRSPGESPHGWWALGRLGARVPFYGSAHEVVPKDVAMDWLEVLLTLDWRAANSAAFAAAHLARLSGDRERDLDAATREQVGQRLRAARAPALWVRMVEEVAALDSVEQQRIFGESLPPGLRLVR